MRSRPPRQGCRLEIREVTTHGAWSAEQHEPREQQLRQALTVRLPAILDWLAFQQVDLRRADGGMTAELPLIGVRGRAGPDPRRRRQVVAALVAGAVPLGGVGGMGDVAARLEASRRARPRPRRASPTATPVEVAAAPRRRPRRAPREPPRRRPPGRAGPRRRSPRRTPTSAAPPPPSPPPTARYETDSEPTVRLHRRDRGRQPRRRTAVAAGRWWSPSPKAPPSTTSTARTGDRTGGRSPSPERPCPPVGPRRSASTYATTGRRPGNRRPARWRQPCAGL